MSNDKHTARVLIVDDSPANLGVISAVLTSTVGDLRVAMTGEDALEQASYERPDLILLDVNLPGIDGFETCRRLKANPATNTVPVIFMTALSNTGEKVRGLELGAVDYITKPFQQDELLARVKVHLKLVSLSRALEEKNAVLQREIRERAAAEDALAEVTKELVAAARKAGMTEVTVNVLHNVGNVITSVGVETTLMLEQMTNDRSFSLDPLDAMLKEHAEEITRFLTIDPKGRLVPSFISRLADHQRRARADFLASLRSIAAHVEHIQAIIGHEQANARGLLVIEETPLEQVFDEAVRIAGVGKGWRGTELIRDFAAVPPVQTDRHQVLSILVNLVTNARHACASKPAGSRLLTLRLYMVDDGRVGIDVTDNGIGIARDDLPRIFRHGFTTRTGGHGFGLHSGILAARSLGGDLTARSEGLGRGATFTLELPLRVTAATPQVPADRPSRPRAVR